MSEHSTVTAWLSFQHQMAHAAAKRTHCLSRRGFLTARTEGKRHAAGFFQKRNCTLAKPSVFIAPLNTGKA